MASTILSLMLNLASLLYYQSKSTMKYRIETIDTKNADFLQHKAAITKSLRLDRLKQVPESTCDELAKIVTLTALRGWQLTGVPYPKYQVQRSKRMERSGYIAEMNLINVKRGTGDRARINAKYMQAIANRLSHPLSKASARAELENTLYHEMYHSKQVRQTQHAYYLPFKLKNYSHDHHMEVGARLFAIAAQSSQPIENVSDLIVRAIAIKEGIIEKLFHYKLNAFLTICLKTPFFQKTIAIQRKSFKY